METKEPIKLGEDYQIPVQRRDRATTIMAFLAMGALIAMLWTLGVCLNIVWEANTIINSYATPKR